MTTAPDLPQRVSRLENDVSAIYEMLGRIQSTQTRHGTRLEELAATQVEHTATLANHTATLGDHTATLDSHTATLDSHTATLANHTATLANHTATLGDHTGKLDRILELLERR